MCFTHDEHQLGTNEVCLQCLWERQAGDSPRRCPRCGGYLCSRVCQEDHAPECEERSSTESEGDNQDDSARHRQGAADRSPAPRCLQRCAFGYSGPHQCVQLCKHAKGHYGSHDCMQHQCRPKRPPPGPPPIMLILGDSEVKTQPAEARPRCQCWCGWRRQPGRNCRRHCPLCSRMVGPGWGWMGDEIDRCHMCYGWYYPEQKGYKYSQWVRCSQCATGHMYLECPRCGAEVCRSCSSRCERCQKEECNRCGLSHDFRCR